MPFSLGLHLISFLICLIFFIIIIFLSQHQLSNLSLHNLNLGDITDALITGPDICPLLTQWIFRGSSHIHFSGMQTLPQQKCDINNRSFLQPVHLNVLFCFKGFLTSFPRLVFIFLIWKCLSDSWVDDFFPVVFMIGI